MSSSRLLGHPCSFVILLIEECFTGVGVGNSRKRRIKYLKNIPLTHKRSSWIRVMGPWGSEIRVLYYSVIEEPIFTTYVPSPRWTQRTRCRCGGDWCCNQSFYMHKSFMTPKPDVIPIMFPWIHCVEPFPLVGQFEGLRMLQTKTYF